MEEDRSSMFLSTLAMSTASITEIRIALQLVVYIKPTFIMFIPLRVIFRRSLMRTVSGSNT